MEHTCEGTDARLARPALANRVVAMSSNAEFQINETLYQWCVRAFSMLRRRLGIHIKVHGADEHMKAGQIFLFNHFTRFETIIPQYFIYQATGAYCRCVASHKFFQAGEQFAKLLWSCGAVPNNHPGLLAFLAAEILRGRKVIFFPEGQMVKDRQTVTKHRQGAAALALVLEIFKKRILQVYDAGETDRLERWVKALGLADIGALIAAARQPTLIIPAAITFNPIHTSDNILRKAAELFGRELSEESKAELLIESNLVFKRTDMDIRFGNPIHPRLDWSLLDKFLLSHVFEHIHSLEELFALKDTASRWVDRLLAMTMRRETQRLRDKCMKEMYARVTVNLNHIASRLVLGLLKRGVTELERDRFHRLLYSAFKNVQKDSTVALHRSLNTPDIYDGIHTGTSRLVSQFVDAAAGSRLMEATSTSYRFLPVLQQKTNGRDPRLENIIVVYANEIAPLAPTCLAIDSAMRDEAGTDKRKLAWLLFDDELRAFASCKESYSRAQFAAINDQEQTEESGEPYLLTSGSKNLGIVLVHDFLAFPAELRGFGRRLAALGYPVLGVRLKGHGTSPWDLRERNRQDWLNSVRRGIEIVSGIAEQVCIIGFSTGGALALLAAAEKPKCLAGVAAVAAPLKLRNYSRVFVPVMHGINKLSEWAYSDEGLMPFLPFDAENPKLSYRHVPTRGFVELRLLIEETERRLPDVVCPVRVLQATDDPRVDPESAILIHDKLGSTDKSVRMLKSNRHGILAENLGGSQELIISFVDELASAVHASPHAVSVLQQTPLTASQSFKKSQVTDKTHGVMPRSLASFLRPLRRVRAEPPQPERSPIWEKSYPPGISWKTTIEPMPVPSLLDNAVRSYADKTCMSFRGKHYRYRDVDRLVTHAAKGFQDLGVGKGIKVGLMLPNCPYAVVCFYAVLKAGGIVVNINPLYSQGEIERQITDSGCRILVTLDAKAIYEKASALVSEGGQVENLVICRMKGVLRFTEKVALELFKGGEIASVTEDERHLFFEHLIANNGLVKVPDIDPVKDVAVLQYTGGTTGHPKGAQLTHANVYVNAAQLALWAPQVRAGKEKCVAALPLFHSFGMTAVMNLSIWIGAEMVLLAKFNTAEVLKLIVRERPTIFIGVPTMYSAMTVSGELAKHDLSSLKVCISGGAALPGEIQRRFEAASGCRIIEGYGLSEASPVCTINPLSGGKAGSVGLPLPGTVIELVSIENPDLLLGPNERGEICVSGPQVMAGYANRAKDNLDVFRGGRLHTGDVGYLDEEGYLFIVDRIKELIISGGFNVYPRQVEEVIHSHPSVEEVAVCGLPDLHRGEIVKAFVKLRAGEVLTANELRDFCRDRLAPFQVPKQIEFRDFLPKTIVGKISKRDLLAESVTKPEQAPALNAESGT
jgi:acyl-CoA synthetase (AMP-forming)/AMP-acid ligase II/esterase/lipase/1-acyl-sn-glycerol-3-phosphate acyltransferase